MSKGKFLVFCAMLVSSYAFASPSFDCTKVVESSIEQLICNDDKLSALDRKLSANFKEAGTKVESKNQATLKAMQRGWIKGRNDCWKNSDQRQCVIDSYQMRISELQAEYGLVKSSGSSAYICTDDEESPIEVTYFLSEIPTAKAKRGEQLSLMYGHADANGMVYKGPNETLSVYGEKISVSWGYDSPLVPCKLIGGK
jgi:uncharacterized protein YecT (DUF1311 family)